MLNKYQLLHNFPSKNLVVGAVAADTRVRNLTAFVYITEETRQQR